MSLYSQLTEGAFVIAGPCALESEALALTIGEHVAAESARLGIPMVFKASFDKANRSKANGWRGLGMDEGLRILDEVRTQTGLPILTDIHESAQAEAAGQVADVIQIPAFLCRQTDLLIAAGRTQKIVNIKKAQFLEPLGMRWPAEKVESTGNNQVMLTERGTMFGYNRLIVDFVGVAEMQSLGYPVVMDATHAVQQPAAATGVTAGNRGFVPVLAKAAWAIGVRGFFFEIHPEPDNAPSDAANMLTLDGFSRLLDEMLGA